VKITEALGLDAFDGDAHAFLMAIYKDATQPIVSRMDAAKAAIGYEKPRLAAIDGTIDGMASFEEPRGQAPAALPPKADP
jgi:hypothetical protein